MEVCFNRRVEFKRNGELQAGRRLRGGLPSDCLTLEMCHRIMMDVQQIGLKAEKKIPDKQVARPFALVANNNLMEYVFDWCAENDRDDFPISLAGLRNEGKSAQYA